jgi:hypothetical protein
MKKIVLIFSICSLFFGPSVGYCYNMYETESPEDAEIRIKSDEMDKNRRAKNEELFGNAEKAEKAIKIIWKKPKQQTPERTAKPTSRWNFLIRPSSPRKSSGNNNKQPSSQRSSTNNKNKETNSNRQATPGRNSEQNRQTPSGRNSGNRGTSKQQTLERTSKPLSTKTVLMNFKKGRLSWQISGNKKNDEQETPKSVSEESTQKPQTPIRWNVGIRGMQQDLFRQQVRQAMRRRNWDDIEIQFHQDGHQFFNGHQVFGGQPGHLPEIRHFQVPEGLNPPPIHLPNMDLPGGMHIPGMGLDIHLNFNFAVRQQPNQIRPQAQNIQQQRPVIRVIQEQGHVGIQNQGVHNNHVRPQIQVIQQRPIIQQNHVQQGIVQHEVQTGIQNQVRQQNNQIRPQIQVIQHQGMHIAQNVQVRPQAHVQQEQQRPVIRVIQNQGHVGIQNQGIQIRN